MEPNTGLNNKVSATCGSGGAGSAQCSTTSGGEGCSVYCKGGYYACCNSSSGKVTCKCEKNEK